MQDPSKFTQIGGLGLKINHLATLVVVVEMKLPFNLRPRETGRLKIELRRM
jgi:hypothetical protein